MNATRTQLEKKIEELKSRGYWAEKLPENATPNLWVVRTREELGSAVVGRALSERAAWIVTIETLRQIKQMG